MKLAMCIKVRLVGDCLYFPATRRNPASFKHENYPVLISSQEVTKNKVGVGITLDIMLFLISVFIVLMKVLLQTSSKQKLTMSWFPGARRCLPEPDRMLFGLQKLFALI